MFDTWLWAIFTVLAAAGQTARNAMQRELTATLGTVGATHVRFLFGFPFALLFLAGVVMFSGAALPRPSLSFVPWLLAGALFQIGATATMLAAPSSRAVYSRGSCARASASRHSAMSTLESIR